MCQHINNQDNWDHNQNQNWHQNGDGQSQGPNQNYHTWNEGVSTPTHQQTTNQATPFLTSPQMQMHNVGSPPQPLNSRTLLSTLLHLLQTPGQTLQIFRQMRDGQWLAHLSATLYVIIDPMTGEYLVVAGQHRAVALQRRGLHAPGYDVNRIGLQAVCQCFPSFFTARRFSSFIEQLTLLMNSKHQVWYSAWRIWAWQIQTQLFELLENHVADSFLNHMAYSHIIYDPLDSYAQETLNFLRVIFELIAYASPE